jgi:hypothetical protein
MSRRSRHNEQEEARELSRSRHNEREEAIEL